MVGKQEGKPLSFKAVEMMKPGDKDKADSLSVSYLSSPLVDVT